MIMIIIMKIMVCPLWPRPVRDGALARLGRRAGQRPVWAPRISLAPFSAYLLGMALPSRAQFYSAAM